MSSGVPVPFADHVVMGDASPSLPDLRTRERTPTRLSGWRRAVVGCASLTLILEVSLGLRIVAADLVQVYVDRKSVESQDPAHPQICVFPDTHYYWDLARSIREGAPYEVMLYGDIPHFALRTPGYPLFLAFCQVVFGARAFPVRIVQAFLGVLSVWLVYQLTRSVFEPNGPNVRQEGWTVPLAAAAIAAVEPYTVSISPLILSEALFVPLMLTALWGMAKIWNGPIDGRVWWRYGIPLGVGASNAAAVLVRPSWLLFTPIMLGLWIISGLQRRRALAQPRTLDLAQNLRYSGWVMLGFVVVMSSWWVRNQAIYGRFVSTALWTGASLYDGLSPQATGGSDMTFLSDPEIWPLGEEEQDAELTHRAMTFALREPGRAIGLAVNKLWRYWRPWPDAGVRSAIVHFVSSVITVPLFGLIGAGVWQSRRDFRTCILLAGPIFYFCLLHIAFASSMRYRIPGEVPALGLAALGLGALVKRLGWKPAC